MSMGDGVWVNAGRGALITAGAAVISLRWMPGAWSDYTGSSGIVAFLLAVLLHAIPGALALGIAGALEAQKWHPALALGLGMTIGEAACRWLPVPLGFTAGLVQAWVLLGPAALLGRPLLAGTIGAALGCAKNRRLLAVVALFWLGSGRAFVDYGVQEQSVGIVQTGVDGFAARRPSASADRAEQLVELTQLDADWVLTPESAWPYAMGQARGGRAAFETTWQGHPPVLLGGWTDSEPAINRIGLVVDGRVAAHVDKSFVIPFAEATAGFAAGDAGRDVRVAGGIVSVLVCWEDVLPRAIAAVSPMTDILALPSSDVWLGPTGQRHHADAARYAAVTTGRWVVRATPTGQSGLIDPRGQWRMRVAEDGAHVVQVPMRPRGWIPAWWGGWLGGLASIAAGILWLLKR